MDEHVDREESLRKTALAVYVLQAASFLVGLTLIVGVIINYVKRADAAGTWLASHFRWQIRTFWFYLLFMVAAGITLPVGIGVFIGVAAMVWLIYRIVKGWLSLADRKPMYLPKA